MAIKVIAQLREVKLGKNPGKKFVMRPGGAGRGHLCYFLRRSYRGNVQWCLQRKRQYHDKLYSRKIQQDA